MSRRVSAAAGRRTGRLCSCLVLAASALVASGAAAEPTGPFEWRGVDRVVAIGDLHGHYNQMLALLEGAELIDSDLAWTGGAAHLVLLGDLVDRGPADRAILDLARRIQRQAEAAGGRVHVLLGNHEVMNLAGDYRYVARQSFADFAGAESEEERRRGLKAFRRTLATRGMSSAGIEAAFDERFPPGYFAWARALAPDGEIGSWLIEQPTVIKVNGRLFVHGGLTEEVAALGLEEINRRMSASLVAFVDAGRRLGERAEWPRAYDDLMWAARAADPGGRRASGRVAEAARSLLAASEDLPFATDGPVWYRGNSVENERLEQRRIDRVLELLDADGLVVGHTVTRSGHITSRFNGRFHRTDVGMGYGRPGRALVMAGGEIRTLNPSTGSFTGVFAESPQGQGWPQGEEELPNEVLERFLGRARIQSITFSDDLGLPLKLLELEDDGIHLRAVFGSAQETTEQAAAGGRTVPRRFQNTIAAYRLDRRLGLDMVPVSVPRRVEGTRGLVQVWVQGAWDQSLLEEYEAWSYLDGLETQIAEARAFSALIGIADRVPAGRMLMPLSKRILLADNSVSFPVDGDLDVYLPEGCGPVGPAFLAAVRSLERRELNKLFGDLVSRAAVDALLERRDELVERCESPAPDWSIDEIVERIRSEGAAR